MNRATYWLCVAIFVVVMSIFAYTGSLHGGMEVAMITIGVPRLHDIGRSGWIVLSVIGVEFGVVIAALVAEASVDEIYLIGGILFAVISALGIWLGTIPGENAANKWGDPPAPGINFGKLRKKS